MGKLLGRVEAASYLHMTLAQFDIALNYNAVLKGAEKTDFINKGLVIRYDADELNKYIRHQINNVEHIHTNNENEKYWRQKIDEYNKRIEACLAEIDDSYHWISFYTEKIKN